jgi:hypothetical protein
MQPARRERRRLRQAGTQLLEALGVLKPLHPGSGVDDPNLVVQVARLLEYATNTMDGFALAQLGIDIDRFEDEGIITEGDRITEKVVELADGEHTSVKLERCADGNQVRYRDPLTGTDVVLPAKHARRWKVHLNWLREEIITALGTALQGVRGKHQDEEPIFWGSSISMAMTSRCTSRPRCPASASTPRSIPPCACVHAASPASC